MLKVITFIFVSFHLLLSSQNIDIRLLREINVHRNSGLDQSFKIITNSHSIVSLSLFTGVSSFALIKNDSVEKKHAILIAGGLISSAMITYIVKFAKHRERPFKTYPEIVQLSTVDSYSFPSGHTSEAFATATSFSLCYPRWYIIVPTFTWAGLVGYSRMHLGVHYPSDVLAGAIIGIGCSYLSYWLTKKITGKLKKHAVVSSSY